MMRKIKKRQVQQMPPQKLTSDWMILSAGCRLITVAQFFLALLNFVVHGAC